MSAPTKSVSERTRDDAGLTAPELWRRYVELGGMSTSDEVDAILRNEVQASEHDHEVLAHTLNERFSELGRNHPVRLTRDRP